MFINNSHIIAEHFETLYVPLEGRIRPQFHYIQQKPSPRNDIFVPTRLPSAYGNLGS